MNEELKDLEELEVVEAKELEIGNAFHAFRFIASPEESADEE